MECLRRSSDNNIVRMIMRTINLYSSQVTSNSIDWRDRQLKNQSQNQDGHKNNSEDGVDGNAEKRGY